MDEPTACALIRAFTEVLEKQVFLFADAAVPEDFVARPGGYFAASVAFRGPAEGTLSLAVPASLAREIAANFLGLDGDDPMVDAHARDACGELLNMTCGHVLTALYGASPVFDLARPEVAEVGSGRVSDWAMAPETLCFDVDGPSVLFRIERAPATAEGEGS